MTSKNMIFKSVTLLSLCSCLASAQTPHYSLLDMDLANLSQITVYTANRELTSIEKSASSVSVITAQEIKKRGYHNLKEVLDRVPGFFNSPDQSFPLISNRGYTQNPNNNYLLLIDGHAINSVNDVGIGNSHMLPYLYQVKQIEIVRGPGSTLWGGDAANGIINVITYDGKDLAKDGEFFAQATADYELTHNRYILNALFASQLNEDVDFMFSATHTESKADFLGTQKATTDGLVDSTTVAYKHEAYRPSYELHAKLNYKDVRVSVRSARNNVFYRVITAERDYDQRDFDFDYVELSYTPQITKDLTLESDIYHNYGAQFWNFYNDDGTPSTTKGTEHTYTENGLNAILTYKGLQTHSLKAGVQWQRRDFKPKEKVDGTILSLGGIENAKGLFIEDTYSGIEDWTFILGARHQENDFRQAGEEMLYRAAAIWQASDNWTLKYMYNSGIVPATVTRSRGTTENLLVVGGFAEVGPTEPQLSISNELQLLYSDNNTLFTFSLFQQDLENFIAIIDTFETGESLDGYPIRIRETNVGDLQARGIELDFQYKMNHSLLLYGNYSWAVNIVENTTGEVDGLEGSSFDLVAGATYFTEDGQSTGVPEHIWNFGVDWTMASKYHWNLHYRGWNASYAGTSKSPAEFTKYGPEHYIDITLFCENCLVDDLDMQIYGKNIFNNTSELASAPHNGTISGLGAELGMSLAYRF